jgi:hypothetical protein
MRNILTIISATLLTVGVPFIQKLQAQAPAEMTYQAVIRDASNALVSNQQIGMKISILEGSVTGVTVYEETQTPTSNANGLVNITIGSGTVVSGSFATINWKSGIFFMKTETDPLGGTAYTITGTSQFMSVPYALYAESAGNTFSGDYNDLANKPASTGFDGTFSGLSGVPTGLSDGDDNTQLDESQVDAFVTNNGYLTAEVDGSITNEIELPAQSGNSGKVLTTDGTSPAWSTVSFNDLTDVPPSASFDGTFSSLSGIPTGLSDGDDNTQLTETEVDAFAANNGYLTAEIDGSTTNEIQDLQLSGNNLTITNNGLATTIDLSPYLDNTDTKLTEAEVDAFAANNGYLTAEVDGSTTNEIQDLQLVGNNLTITNNGTATMIDLSAYLDNTDTKLTEVEVDAFSANNGYLTTEVDGSVTNEIQDLQLSGNNLTITNNGTATTIDLSPYLDNTDTKLTEAEVDAFAANNGYLTSEVDGSITNEIELPSQTGQSGKYLTTNGASPSWNTVATGAPSVRTISANTTLLNTDEIVFINGAFTVTFPASPTDGMKLTIASTNSSAGVNGNGKTLYLSDTGLPSLTFLDVGVNVYTFYYSSTMGVWLGIF